MSRRLYMSRCTVSGNPQVNDDQASVPNSEKRSDGQFVDHWVLCDEEIAKGFVRPVRLSYVHEKCGTTTSMPRIIAETYAVKPSYYGKTFCCACGDYFPVGINGEFVWEGTNEKVGS